MTEDDKFRIELHRSDIYYGDPLAADRIEELLKERDALTTKLAKAVEAVKNLKAQWYIRDLQQSDFDAVLAELEMEE